MVDAESKVVDALRELGGKLRRGETVHALVGAGLSAGAGLPSWTALLDELEGKVRAVGQARATKGARPKVKPLERDERAQADLPWRAQLIESSDGGRRKLRSNLKKKFIKKTVAPNGPLRSVVDLPFQHILTTNYDNLLDLTHAGSREGLDAEVLRWELPKQRSRFIESLGRPTSSRFYLHLHGRADAPETCIITEEDYRDRYLRSETLARNLYALFASQTVVFIGFSLTDRDFVEILREVQAHGSGSPRHYAILPRPDEGEAGLTAYLLGKFGVAPILYPNTDGRHEGLAMVLRDLESLARSEHDWAFVDVNKPQLDGSPQKRSDPNFGQFGRSARRDGLRLSVKNIVNWSNDTATFTLEVARTDRKKLTEPVAFYLHPSFREVVVRVVPSGGKATLNLHAYGAFTVGAVVGKKRVLLELDLEFEKAFSRAFRSAP
jgi:hypothetical protein